MGDGNPFDTQRYPPSLTAELGGVGFDHAEEIGRGGFGVVFRCTQVELDRVVAVKVLTVDLDEENTSRFFREQRAMGRLTGHPNIVNILQVGTTNSGLPFIVMPYHPQDSLDAQVRRRGPVPLGQALRLGVKIAGAVETAHRLGILHRDVKPANILLTEYGEPELADFGIAHIAGGFETTTGALTGSPAYTAPEVLGGDPPSPAADIYSLGATIFTALTGHAAFERRSGEQVVAQFLRITAQAVPDLRDHGIPDDVSDAIALAMSRTADGRPATAADFGDILRELQRNHGFPVDEMALPVEPGAVVDTDIGDREQESDGRRRPRGSRATLAVTGSLPSELTSFVGRQHEITEAKNLLAGSRLVTLTGIGGVGKTRLALQVAAAVQREYPDDVRLVEMGDLRDMSSVVEAVTSAVRVRADSARPLLEVLVEALAPRELLLVLDNCEQVVEAVAKIAETLLRACRRLRILATSRTPLAIGGEAVLHVRPLAVPNHEQQRSLRGLRRFDAVALFVERGMAAVPGFELTEDNAAAVAGICRRLDGLPLPIELAAARLRAMSPEQVLQRLTDRFALLTRASRDAPTRQQTLRLCVDWSFELCTIEEQLVWGWLTVFAGSFDLEAAEQVCDIYLSRGDLLDAVTSLVDKSILIREESGAVVRFRMLDTLRDYGQEKLAQTRENIAVRRRHRDFYKALALGAEAEWIGARQSYWIARLKREQTNLREALEFCVDDDISAGLRIANALYWYWLFQGLYNECRRWLDRLLACGSGPSTPERAKALYFASVMAAAQGDLRSAELLVEEGRTLSTPLNDRMVHALADCGEGMLALYSGDLSRACPFLEAALAEFRQSGERTLEISVEYALVLSYGLCGLTEKSIEYHERVLAVTEKEKIYRSYSLWAMAIVVWRQGQAEHAVRLLEQSLKLNRHARIAAACLEALAWIACERQDPLRAATLLGAAAELASPMDSTSIIFSTLRVFHQNCESEGRRQLGDKEFEKAHQTGRRLSSDAAIAYALYEKSPSTVVPDTHAPTRLTKRERQVAALIAEGLTNQAIADRLVISPRTAQGHVEHILVKLDFTSRTQIAAWVVAHQESRVDT
ncbi:protein kinase [Nocardia sp. NPDC059246]|uniref:protein kinase domain-containing protein n=1 Tax=unclassified Nocardia TaxID=2637762 RepID=UPI003690E7B3